ncbi:hypothetical protein ACFO4E_22220 [Nocardiopsis mangrovi]|uniref:Secreted protein n=1 Tax=Nocardiopsis mangrovi TaxID=1179818 RepID=A0ABV9E1M0_9ACTN
MVLAATCVSPASAAIVPCTANSVVSSWRAQCERTPTDGDAGGVSGKVTVWYPGNSAYYASVEFRAHGEISYLRNHTTTTAYLRVATRNEFGDWENFIDQVVRGPGYSDTVNRSLDEGDPVRVQVCLLDRGCATIATLIS